MKAAAPPRPPPTQIVVGVAAKQVSKDPRTRLVTFALGSCIGVTVWDPITHVGGMLHYLLAQPVAGADDTASRPFMYATTGLDALFASVAALGTLHSRLIVCAAGAAEVLRDGGMFAIGERNRTMMRRVFWKENIVLAAEDTGGNAARNLGLDVGTGRVWIKTRGQEKQLWPR